MGAGLRDVGPKEVKSLPISKTWSGDTDPEPIVPAVPGKKIVVVGFFYTNDSLNSITIKNGTTAVTGAMITTANGWVKGNYNPDGHFQTSAGAALNFVPSGVLTISGWINYYLE